MERGWQLESASRPPRTGVRAIVFSLFILSSWHSLGQEAEQAAHIRQLFEQSRWQEVVDNIQPLPAGDADLHYYYGSALAQLGRWDEAREALVAGQHLASRDKRFPIELAGVAFKQQRYEEAAKWLRCGLRIDPGDAYADDFLGTVYFLEDNLEASLKYWNRVEKPQIASVKTEHPLQIRPWLLDRALTFAPGEQLRVADFRSSRARIDGLAVFVAPNLQLAARHDGKFDAVLNFTERNGWGSNKWAALLSTFSGIAYQTIYPVYFNIGHEAVNFRSLVRWDAQKRRTAADLSGPLRGNPKRSYRLGIDLRNENWAIRSSFRGVAPVLSAMNLRREVADAEVRTIQSGRWQWSTGMELSHRDYRSIDVGSALTPQLLMEGMQLKTLASTEHELWRVPEHRFVIDSGGSWQLARIWSQDGHVYSKFQGSVLSTWLPKARGDDYATRVQLRAGGAAGSVPFDELYLLGLERDNELWLRAHIGTRDGVKGSAPLGTRYLLINSDFDKRIYGNGLVTFKLSPFIDTGKISGAMPLPDTQRWLWDTGLQLKLSLLGLGMSFTWGKDLRTGNTAWYFTSARP